MITFNSGISLSYVFFKICFRWSFDETVTHFIYQGRPNDTNREYKSVKERGVHIVSEHWLLEVSSTFFLPYLLNENEYKHYFKTQASFHVCKQVR